MANAVIVGNGDFPRTEYPRYIVASADYIVCCDGALASWLRNSPKIFTEERLPDAIVGDMDSLSPSLQRKYKDRIFSVDEQDFNDQTKALLYVLKHFPDVDCIHLIAATGKREDHTIGNISLMMEYARALAPAGSGPDNTDYPKDFLSGTMAEALRPYRERGIRMDMTSDYSTIIAVTGSCEIAVGEGREVSIISADNSLRIKSEGLQWQTEGVVFDNLWKATLNRATEDMVKLNFSHPSAALLILS